MALSSVAFDESFSYISKIRQSVTLKKGHVSGWFQFYKLNSAFQPIYSLAHKRIVGYEALVRVTNRTGQAVPPPQIFSPDLDNSDHVFLDRLCRYIHMGNFKRVHDDLNWLFLNVSPYVLGHGAKFGPFFREFLEEYRFPPHRIVVEIVEHPISDKDLLLDTVDYYKRLGCLIAIDDFGAGHSNFERIWALSPHIVKLDRSMILRASKQTKIRQLLPNIVSLLHQAGSLVLMEGIETLDQALISMECDADFVQGYYFSKPTGDIKRLQSGFSDFDGLFERFKTLVAQHERGIEGIYDDYRIQFTKAIDILREGESLRKASLSVMNNKSVVRCYLLSANGVQIGSTVVRKSTILEEDYRFRPLEDAKSADWFRRHYLRRAVLHPDQLQVTRPYLSITGSHMCITLSIMFSTDWGNMVFCCDINTNESVVGKGVKSAFDS